MSQTRIATAEVKQYVLDLGATIVGIANVERFAHAPRGHRPQELLPGARSVIVIGVKLLESIVGWDRLFRESDLYTTEQMRLAIAKDHLYARSGYETINTFLEQLGLRTGLWMESRGFRSMYFPATFAHHAPVMEKVPGYYAPFSHKHAAVMAGLGEFGLNNLVLTPEFGPRVRFMSVITRADLEPDPLLTEPVCLRDACALCVEYCGVRGIAPLESADRDAVFLSMPSVVDKEACFYKVGGATCWGTCIDVCPVGKGR